MRPFITVCIAILHSTDAQNMEIEPIDNFDDINYFGPPSNETMQEIFTTYLVMFSNYELELR